MVRFGEKEIAKKKFYAAKKAIKFWDVNVDNIVISKSIETKTNSKYLIGIKFDKAMLGTELYLRTEFNSGHPGLNFGHRVEVDPTWAFAQCISENTKIFFESR